VCLSEAIGPHRHVILAFITSVVPSSLSLEATDLLLEPGTADFPATGLRVRSVVRLHRMVTVSATILQRQLGMLTPSLQSQVQQRLRQLFGI